MSREEALSIVSLAGMLARIEAAGVERPDRLRMSHETWRRLVLSRSYGYLSVGSGAGRSLLGYPAEIDRDVADGIVRAEYDLAPSSEEPPR